MMFKRALGSFTPTFPKFRVVGGHDWPVGEALATENRAARAGGVENRYHPAKRPKPIAATGWRDQSYRYPYRRAYLLPSRSGPARHPAHVRRRKCSQNRGISAAADGRNRASAHPCPLRPPVCIGAQSIPRKLLIIGKTVESTLKSPPHVANAG